MISIGLTQKSSINNNYAFYFFKNLFIFKQTGREGEREGEKHQCVVASHTSTNGDPAHNPGMFSHWELIWQPLGPQANAQSTEPRQPGLIMSVIILGNLVGVVHFLECIRDHFLQLPHEL